MRAEPNDEPMPVASIAPSLRKAVQAIDPDLPLQEIRTQQEQIDTSMQQERIIASLTASFGVLALVFASVGVYGVMAYSVAQRRSEIGIRMALGALPREVLTMVLREATWIALVGITCGIGATLHAASPIHNSNCNSAMRRSNQRACPLASMPMRTVSFALARAW